MARSSTDRTAAGESLHQFQPRLEKESRSVRSASREEAVSMTSTEAQNGFGRMLDAVAKGVTVRIKKHHVTRAVVISADRYEELIRGESPTLDTLTAEFDDLLARMQTPEARAGMQAAFDASPDVLASAAVAAATRRKE